MAYGSVAGVEALVPEMGTLTTSTTPTIAEVTVWLGQAYAIINRKIGDAGYSIPIASIAALYPELTGLENLYAAAYAIRARGIDTSSGEDEKTSEVWLRDFYSQLNDLVASNLALLGASALPTSTSTRRRRLRTVQMRRVDGYSRGSTDDFTVHQGEYTGPTAPSE